MTVEQLHRKRVEKEEIFSSSFLLGSSADCVTGKYNMLQYAQMLKAILGR